jgi:hypothetical protein
MNKREKKEKRIYEKQKKISELKNEWYKKKNIYEDIKVEEKSIGFIILRKVIDFNTSRYWKKCYECIRLYYPDNFIIIIDDNSEYNFIDKNYESNLIKTKIINSEYHNRGEILPYYYYLHNKLFDIAVIIHDSVFINSEINFYTKTYKLLWDFDHQWDCPDKEIEIMNKLKNSEELIKFYSNKILWNGCFGGMSAIAYDYLKYLDSIYDIKILLQHIYNRSQRMCFERIIACILIKNAKGQCLFGNINKYYNDKKFDEIKFLSEDLPIIKIWTGR